MSSKGYINRGSSVAHIHLWRLKAEELGLGILSDNNGAVPRIVFARKKNLVNC